MVLPVALDDNALREASFQGPLEISPRLSHRAIVRNSTISRLALQLLPLPKGPIESGRRDLEVIRIGMRSATSRTSPPPPVIAAQSSTATPHSLFDVMRDSHPIDSRGIRSPYFHALGSDHRFQDVPYLLDRPPLCSQLNQFSRPLAAGHEQKKRGIKPTSFSRPTII